MRHHLAYLCTASFVLGAATGMAVLVSTVSGSADRSIMQLEERLAALERAAVPRASLIGSEAMPPDVRLQIERNAAALAFKVFRAAEATQPGPPPRGAEPFEFNGMTFYNMPLCAR